MKFYRVALYCDFGVSAGYEFTLTRKEAERIGREHSASLDESAGYVVESVEVSPGRLGIISALRKYASHPDNG